MKTYSANSTLLTVLLTALSPVIWGTTYMVTTEFLPEDRPLITAVIRTLPAGLLLIGLTGCFSPTIAWGRLLLLSILNIGAFQVLLFVAAYRLPGGIAAVVGAFQPLMILALTWGIDRQRHGTVTLGTAMGGMAGMSLLFASPGGRWDAIGLSAAVVGTTSMALGTFLSGRWQNDMPLLGFTGWQLSLGGLSLLPFVFLGEESLPSLTASNWMGYLYLSVFGTLLAYSLWFRGISLLSPVAVSALGLLSPVTAIAVGWALLGESLGLRETAGILFVLLSVVALQLSDLKTSKTVSVHTSVERKLGKAT